MLSDFFNNVLTKIPYLAFQTMTQCNNIIIIYGGLTTTDKINGDVNILKLDGISIATASYEKNTKNFPIPRHSHTGCYDEYENKVYFFGGYSTQSPFFLNQLSIMNISKKSSISFQNSKIIDGISPRCRHTAFLNKRKLYIYGGYGIHAISKKIRNDSL